MIRYLIKNYLKMMGRSPVNVLLFIVFPIVLIAVLSSAFSSLMESYERKESFSVGYIMEDDSIFGDYMEEIKKIARENEVTFKAYDEGDPDKLMKDEELESFVIFGKDDYVIYKRTGSPTEGMITEYILTAFMRNMETYREGMMRGMEVPQVELDVSYPDHMPEVDSIDYYGKIEIIYFVWCGLICFAGIIMAEKRYKISQRLLMSGLSVTKIYLAKLISSTIIVSACTLIAALASIAMFGVKWGAPLKSALVIFLMIVAALCMELMIYYICDNMVITIVISFAAVWIAGFFSGSFETYLFSSHPESTKVLFPIYHGNRAIVELASGGRSDYFMSSVIYSLSMIVGCSILALIAGKIRRRGRA